MEEEKEGEEMVKLDFIKEEEVEEEEEEEEGEEEGLCEKEVL